MVIIIFNRISLVWTGLLQFITLLSHTYFSLSSKSPSLLNGNCIIFTLWKEFLIHSDDWYFLMSWHVDNFLLFCIYFLVDSVTSFYLKKKKKTFNLSDNCFFSSVLTCVFIFNKFCVCACIFYAHCCSTNKQMLANWEVTKLFS